MFVDAGDICCGLSGSAGGLAVVRFSSLGDGFSAGFGDRSWPLFSMALFRPGVIDRINGTGLLFKMGMSGDAGAGVTTAFVWLV